MSAEIEERLYHSQPVEPILKDLGVDPDQGLTESTVRRRLEDFGPNSLRRIKRRGAWHILIEQFKSVVILVLLGAGAVAFSFRHWAEGIAIAAVLLINALIGFVTEWKAVRSMEALRALADRTARVRREGAEVSVDIEQLVPGDLIVVEGGDIVSVDARLIEANDLRMNESALTGESAAVRKETAPTSPDAELADRSSMIFKGTTATSGSGTAVTVSTGMATELGRISEMTQTASSDATPLQKRLDRLGGHLAWLTIGVAALIAVGGWLVGQDPRKMIETALALGVAAIPEGLPIVATIALARGMVLMARRNVLIKRLPAVETLGATQVIFTDKTGTLTENRMSLRKVLTPHGDFTVDERSGSIDAGGDADDALLRRIIEIGLLCSNASLNETGQDDDS
ncbi:MAG: HAD-IC family P-type ATPase, partial [Desulfosarcina sp.]